LQLEAKDGGRTAQSWLCPLGGPLFVYGLDATDVAERLREREPLGTPKAFQLLV